MSKGKGRSGQVRTAPVAIPGGFACAVVAGGRLMAVLWERTPEELETRLKREWSHAGAVGAEGHPADRFLSRYAAGEIVLPDAAVRIPLAWERVGPFDRAVLRAAREVPYGYTVSYGELARMAGCPGAARAAGGALSRNPWPVVVPCHRVVGADGRLGGFGKGLAAKEAILAFEAANAGGAISVIA